MGSWDRLNNFRTNYVDRMVGDKAECSRFVIEEHVLGENANVDLTKLADFAFRHYVPKVQRVPVWKLLLGVTSSAPEVRKGVAEHRVQELPITNLFFHYHQKNDHWVMRHCSWQLCSVSFIDREVMNETTADQNTVKAKELLTSLRTMRLTSVWSDSTEGLDLEYQPTPEDIVRMIRLGTVSTPYLVDSNALEFQAQLAIANKTSAICGSNWVDAYWLTKRFDKLLSQVFDYDMLTEVVHCLKEQYANTYVKSGEDFEAMWKEVPMDLWIRSGGAAVFDLEPLSNLWDKLCSACNYGIIKLFSNSVLRYLIEVRNVMSKQECDEFPVGEGFLSIKTQKIIVAKSITSLLQSGMFAPRKYDI